MTDNELIKALDLMPPPHVTWKCGYRSMAGAQQREALARGLIEVHSSETYRMTEKGWAIVRAES